MHGFKFKFYCLGTSQNRQIEVDEVHKTSHRPPADSNSISLEEQKPFVVISNVKPFSSKNQSNKNGESLTTFLIL